MLDTPEPETRRVDVATVGTDDSASGGQSYVLHEEARLIQVWTAQDRAEHERSVQEVTNRFDAVRQHLNGLRVQADARWERFVILTLERILSGQLREFLDDMDAELHDLNPHLIEMDCEIDRLRLLIQARRHALKEKIAVLEPLAHRTSTQNHIAMMMTRVEGLEASLLDRKETQSDVSEVSSRRQTTLHGDLLYLRIRLLTTRIAVAASNRSKQLNQLDNELAGLLPDIERLKAELTRVMIRFESISDLSRYWLAYLDITEQKNG